MLKVRGINVLWRHAKVAVHFVFIFPAVTHLMNDTHTHTHTHHTYTHTHTHTHKHSHTPHTLTHTTPHTHTPHPHTHHAHHTQTHDTFSVEYQNFSEMKTNKRE